MNARGILPPMESVDRLSHNRPQSQRTRGGGLLVVGMLLAALSLSGGASGLAGDDEGTGSPTGSATAGGDRSADGGTAPAAPRQASPDPQESAADAADADPLRFVRVHIPAEAAAALPQNGRRYVPMPLEAFDAAVERIRQIDIPAPQGGVLDGSALVEQGRAAPPERLGHVRYDSFWSESLLRGTFAFTVSAGSDGRDATVPVAGLLIESVLVESGAGTGAASVVGYPDGSRGILARSAGRYRCSWRLPHDAPADREGREPVRIRLPLVPALASTFSLSLPRDLDATLLALGPGAVADQDGHATGVRPLAVEPEADGGNRFTWMLGPVDTVLLTVSRRSEAAARVFVHNGISLVRRQAEVRATVVPREPWDGRAVPISLDGRIDRSSLAVICPDRMGEESRGSWHAAEAGGGDRLVITPPDRAVGTRLPLVVTGLASFDAAEAPVRVPLVMVDDSAWGGGRIDVVLDDATAFTRIEADDAVVLPVDAGGSEEPRVSVEQQSAAGAVRVSVAARQPSVEVSRVTSVDLSPASVAARAAALLRVSRGEVFDISGRVGPGWFVDAVEVDGAYGPAEWRVDRDGAGAVLRISLVDGLAAGREARLRVVGHRAALPYGRPIGEERLEMVRFDGERADETFVDLRADAESTLFVTGRDGPAPSTDRLPERVRGLCEPQPPRVRLPGGLVAGRRRLTILRRRPPVDVVTSIRATVRDDRISESFTFNCTPRETELDSIVVHFSDATDDTLEWAVLAPSAARAVARRAESDERRSSIAAVAGVESWVVEIQPPVRGPVAVRATRSLALDDRQRVPLAWVEGAPSRTGELVVRDAGRTPPRVLTGGLPELPDSQATDRTAGGIATFMFDVDRDLRDGSTPVEIGPGDADSADARAWVWSERTVSWCHDSGAIEHETVLEIENHGRGSLSLNHPADTRLRGVTLDDIRLPASTSDARGGGMRITLPAGRRFVRLVVRLLASPPAGGDPATAVRSWSSPSQRPAWAALLSRAGILRFAAPSGLVDLPVLQRSWTVLLAPGLEAVGGAAVRGEGEGRTGPDRGRAADWMERLLGCSIRRGRLWHDGDGPLLGGFAGRGAEGGIDAGFRRLDVKGDGSGGTPFMLLMRHDALLRLVLLAGLTGFGVGLWAVRSGRSARRLAVAILLPASAILALWLPEPWFTIPRALLWGLGLPFLVAAVANPASACGGWIGGRGGADLSSSLPPAGGGGDGSAGPAGGTTRSLAGRGAGSLLLASVTAAGGFLESPCLAQPMDVEQVFILEQPFPAGRRGTALVPEQLFRRLTRDAADSTPVGPVVVACRVVAIAGGTGGDAVRAMPDWRYDLALEGAGAFALELPEGAGRFVAGSVRLDGLAIPDILDSPTAHEVPPVPDGFQDSSRRLTLPISEAGRHAVSVGIRPDAAVLSDSADDPATGRAILRAVVHLPAAASVQLVVESPGGTGGSPRPVPSLWIGTSGRGCEGPWLPAEVATVGPTILTGARALALAWPVEQGRRLRRQPEAIDCVDSITWEEGLCRLAAVVEPRLGRAADDAEKGRPGLTADDVFWPMVELAVDPELSLGRGTGEIRDSAGRPVRVDRVGLGRLMIEWLSPVSDSPSVTIPFEMPLEAPVGVFPVPRAWPVGRQRHPGDREVRLTAAPSLNASVELAAASVRLSTSGPGVFDQAAAWIPSPDDARDTVAVTRRRTTTVATQRVGLSASSASVLVSLDATLDAGAEAVAGLAVSIPTDAVVETVRLRSGAPGPPRHERSLDVAVHRHSPTLLAICPQQPPAGRLELSVDLRVPPPADDGWSVLPLAHLVGVGEMPLSVRWTAPDGAIVEFDSEQTQEGETITLPIGGEPPRYRLVSRSAASGEPTGLARARADAPEAAVAPEAATAGDADSAGKPSSPGRPEADPFRVELTDVRLAVDARGRAWGVVRFELVPPRDTTVIRLPRGLRLFGAFVDESPRRARPVDSSGWELDLLDASRPRAVTAVFAGDLGGGLSAGDTVEIEPPRIEGVPTRQVAWTLRGPAGRGLRPVEPSAGVPSERLTAARREALDRLTPDVIRSFEGRTPDEQMRIRNHLDRSVAADAASPEAAWDRSSRGLEAGFFVLDPVEPDGPPARAGGRPLRFRAPATAVPQAAGLAVASLLILTAAVAGARWSTAWGDSQGGRIPRHLIAEAGIAIMSIAWALSLTPVWPAFAAGLGLAINRLRRLAGARAVSRWDPGSG